MHRYLLSSTNFQNVLKKYDFHHYYSITGILVVQVLPVRQRHGWNPIVHHLFTSLNYNYFFLAVLCATVFSLPGPIRTIHRHVQLPTAGRHLSRRPHLKPICGRASINVKREKRLERLLYKCAARAREAEETVSRRLSHTRTITIPVNCEPRRWSNKTLGKQKKKKKKASVSPNHGRCLLFLRLNNWSADY